MPSTTTAYPIGNGQVYDPRTGSIIDEEGYVVRTLAPGEAPPAQVYYTGDQTSTASGPVDTVNAGAKGFRSDDGLYYYNRQTGAPEQRGQSANQIQSVQDTFEASHGGLRPGPGDEGYGNPIEPAGVGTEPLPQGPASGGTGDTSKTYTLGPNMSRDDLIAWMRQEAEKKGHPLSDSTLNYWADKYGSQEFAGDWQYWQDRFLNYNEDFGYRGGAAGGGGENAINEEYLAPYTRQFVDPAEADVPEWKEFGAFEYPDFVAPDPFTYADWKAPDPFSYQAFTAPDANAMMADPGYQFRKAELTGALENSAAARGVLNSGGTIYDLMKNIGAFAAQEYGNVYGRARDSYISDRQAAESIYNTNRDNSLTDWTTNRANAKETWDLSPTGGLAWDTYNANKQNARSTYDTGLADYTNWYNAAVGRAADAHDRAWNQYLTDRDTFYANQNNPYNKILGIAGLGASSSV